jgi:hypothetical protein
MLEKNQKGERIEMVPSIRLYTGYRTSGPAANAFLGRGTPAVLALPVLPISDTGWHVRTQRKSSASLFRVKVFVRKT